MPTRLNPCSYLPRRLQIVATLTITILLCIIFLSLSNTDDIDRHLEGVPFGSQLQSGAHIAIDGTHQALAGLPKIDISHNIQYVSSLNPFRTPVHAPPPVQSNSSSGEARWFNDFKWRNPFSSSVTLDEDRTVLPQMKDRPAIYTYFDPEGRRKDAKSKTAEKDLLQIWRRAWWAQGFKPVVLGPADAMNHALFRVVQMLELRSDLEADIMRWLSWANMGTGIMCHWLALPMAPYDDRTLTFLRRAEFPQLTRYSQLESALVAGAKDDVESFLKEAMGNKDLNNSATLIEALPKWNFTIDDSKTTGVALYSLAKIKEKYPSIDEKLSKNETIADGLAMLPSLINGHLHVTWQESFSEIAVLKPLPEHTSQLIAPAMDLARNISQCPNSPLPSSCPPNNPKCVTCVAAHPRAITTPPIYRNKTDIFTIGTVPHPYTLTSLLHKQAAPENYVKFVRRETTRDPWILEATKKVVKTVALPAYARLVTFKDAVASEYGSSHSIWFVGDKPLDGASHKDIEDVEFVLGFQLPREVLSSGKSETPVPGPERRPPPPKQEYGGGPIPSAADLLLEGTIIEQSRGVLRQSESGGLKKAKADRQIVEAWNLADTEAWKFVRAWNARRRIERRGWEEDEEAFLGKGTLARWRDHFLED